MNIDGKKIAAKRKDELKQKIDLLDVYKRQL